MQRRQFLASSLALVGLTAAPATLRAADTAARREFYELRLYRLRKGPQQQRFDAYAKNAAIPAMNRLGIGPIGVFNVAAGPDSPTVYVLIPYKSLDEMTATTERLRADTEYQKAGADYINATPTDPAYVRVESSLMVAFEGMPKIEVPAGAATNQPRIFELRTYESHSKRAGKKKIEMFNQGEIALFRRTGLAPVFFGETLIGTRLPNLTYMLVFNSMADRDKNWSVFAGDPEWKKLSTTPGYTDAEIVSGISNVFLRPAAYSQI